MTKRRLFILSLCASVLLAGGQHALGWASRAQLESQVARHELVRLHIVANSDGEADQRVKLEIRDTLLRAYSAHLSRARSVEECLQALHPLLPEIEKTAQDVLRARGMRYGARAVLGVSDFPDRQYGSLFVPAGRYMALKVELGEGVGRNWWCVMYPPLCFGQSEELAAPTSVQFDSAIVDWVSSWKRPPVTAQAATVQTETAQEATVQTVHGGQVPAQNIGPLPQESLGMDSAPTPQADALTAPVPNTKPNPKLQPDPQTQMRPAPVGASSAENAATAQPAHDADVHWTMRDSACPLDIVMIAE